MSIKEALDRRQGKQKDVNNALPRHDENAYKRKDYENKVFQKGVDILFESGAVSRLEELRDYILPEFPDAKIENVDPNAFGMPRKFNLLEGGAVEISLGWNYNLSEGASYNRINVIAHPLTGAMVVEGSGAEYIPLTKWRSFEMKVVLEDAIVEAYSNPSLARPSIEV